VFDLRPVDIARSSVVSKDPHTLNLCVRQFTDRDWALCHDASRR